MFCIKSECFNIDKLEKVKLQVEEHIAFVTLNNPPVNAADAQLEKELIGVFSYINTDDDVWVCVMKAEGKSFCVGVDVNLFKKSVMERTVSDTQEGYYDGTLEIYNCRVPVICAVHGYCLGGGMCYPASSDIVIAAEGTIFGIPEVKLCVTGGSGHFARLLPPLIMRNLAYTGAFLPVEELIKYGGVTQIVPREQLYDTARSKAEELCKRGPLILRYLKQCMNRQENFEMKRKNDLEVTYTRYMARHEDFLEGLSAFLEKREPVFLGK